jgi:hypothetical protein
MTNIERKVLVKVIGRIMWEIEYHDEHCDCTDNWAGIPCSPAYSLAEDRIRIYESDCGTKGKPATSEEIADLHDLSGTPITSNRSGRMRILVDWDTDGEVVDWASIFEVPDDLDDEDVADWLSDENGSCVNGWSKVV